MAALVSTVLLVSGITTLLHTLFGTRLPLVQGPSFVYLAPALAIINSPEFFGLNDNVSIFFVTICVIDTCCNLGLCYLFRDTSRRD